MCRPPVARPLRGLLDIVECRQPRFDNTAPPCAPEPLADFELRERDVGIVPERVVVHNAPDEVGFRRPAALVEVISRGENRVVSRVGVDRVRELGEHVVKWRVLPRAPVAIKYRAAACSPVAATNSSR